MKFGVVVFPGSNCDHDAHYALGSVLRQQVKFVWHQSEDVSGLDAIVLPGGFSYGDYLRTGAIARFSPVMRAVDRFARSGGLVLGICNGFQILCEAGLLPGALMRNTGLRFICSMCTFASRALRHRSPRPRNLAKPANMSCTFRSPMPKVITSATLRPSPSYGATSRSCFAIAPPTDASRLPPIPTARWTILPAYAIASATSWA